MKLMKSTTAPRKCARLSAHFTKILLDSIFAMEKSWDMANLIQSLSKPEAFPSAFTEIVIYQTHISAVFLGGAIAYKIKKPVNLGFLDFSTLDRRYHFCEEEVRLNRRLAPDIYLGVVPIAA